MLFKNTLDIIIENNKIYKEIINNIADLFKKIGIDNDPVKIYETFIYMYRNGYLSVKKNFDDETKKSFNELESEDLIAINKVGILIFLGAAVCRHKANFLNLIYQNLGYDSSQIYTYHPRLNIQYNFKNKLLTGYELQPYIEDASKEIDLFGDEYKNIVKKYGDLILYLEYKPLKKSNFARINHTMNIVLDKNNTVHILDSSFHAIGEKVDNDVIQFDSFGFIHKDFIKKEVNDINTKNSLELLKYKANRISDIINSVTYSEICKDYTSEYEDFYQGNKKNYEKISKNVLRLVRKIK